MSPLSLLSDNSHSQTSTRSWWPARDPYTTLATAATATAGILGLAYLANHGEDTLSSCLSTVGSAIGHTAGTVGAVLTDSRVVSFVAGCGLGAVGREVWKEQEGTRTATLGG